MRDAEITILKHLKIDVYADEVCDLQNRGHVSKSTNLMKQCPKLDSGLIVIGGRLKHVDVVDRATKWIILPTNHKVSELICQEHHCYAHLGNEDSG